MENIIRKALWDKVICELHVVCKSIIPKEENRLPTLLECNSNKFNLYTYFFVIDRFLTSTITPHKREVVISTSIQNTTLSAIHRKSFEEIKKLFAKGDASINYISKGYVPNSRKNYFRANGNKYVKDFSSSIWGIRHLHLNPSNKDNVLLYYVIVGSVVYLLKIGGHSDLYTKELLEILINEFPEVLENLGIFPLSEIKVGEHEYDIEEVKRMWSAGFNVSYIINGNYYSSANCQNTSTLNIKFSNTGANISSEIENFIEKFAPQFANIDSNELLKFDITKNYDTFTIKEKRSNIEQQLKIDYFKIVEYAKILNVFVKEPKQR